MLSLVKFVFAVDDRLELVAQDEIANDNIVGDAQSVSFVDVTTVI